MIWTCWVYETRPVEGYIGFDVEAESYEQACDVAREAVLGTRAARSLEVDPTARAA